MKEKWRDKEYRKRHSYLNGHSEERRRKIAAAIKLKWEDPEYRNRTVSAIRKVRQQRVGGAGTGREGRGGSASKIS
jgi:hypothetical protein